MLLCVRAGAAEVGEDCSSGVPATCNAGCSAVVVSFWADCRDSYIQSSAPSAVQTFQGVVRQCQASAGEAVEEPLAAQFGLVCAAESVEDCVPACTEQRHGHVMLVNIEGEDSAYTCELHVRDPASCSLILGGGSCARACSCSHSLCDDGCVCDSMVATPGLGRRATLGFWVPTAAPFSPACE